MPLLLGASDAQATGIPTDRFCGQLDEVRVWSSYRSAATIRQEYTTTVLPPLRAMRGDKGGTRERMPDAISTKVTTARMRAAVPRRARRVYAALRRAAARSPRGKERRFQHGMPVTGRRADVRLTPDARIESVCALTRPIVTLCRMCSPRLPPLAL